MAEDAHSSEMTPDAGTSWVDRCPENMRPYLRLMRADRPIGTWLLLLPCWWGLALASVTQESGNWLDAIWFGLLFAVGAFVMRGAGCVYNDIVDRKIDAKVERTANRPLASGQVSVTQAWALLIALCLMGLFVLIQFNKTAIYTGVAALVLVAGYPFMKRITWWPQAWLGLTFNWGILVGWVAVTGSIGVPAILLYLAGICWTLGYDTIYAHQDKEDDALIGVKSTALRLRENTKLWLFGFYGGVIFFTSLAGLATGLNKWFYIGLLFPVAHFAYQIWHLRQDEAPNCLALFKANRETGFMIILAMLMGVA